MWARNRDVFTRTFRVNFLAPLLEPLLYLVAMGFGLGFFIQQINGVPYIRFIAPSLVAVSMMYASFYECTYGSFVRMYYQKTFDAIVATPVSFEEVVAGELLWGATRSVINATLVLTVIFFWGLTTGPAFLLILPLAFLVGLLFSSIAMCFTAIAPNIDSFNYPFFLFITPMFLFSGTFFPTTVLPLPVQLLAKLILPLAHSVNITRGLTLGTPDASMITSLIWLVVATLIFFVLAINLMTKKLIK